MRVVSDDLYDTLRRWREARRDGDATRIEQASQSLEVEFDDQSATSLDRRDLQRLEAEGGLTQ